MRLVPYVRRSELPARLFPEATRFFESFFNDYPIGDSHLQSRDNWTPSVDILEKDGNLILRAQLPGIEEKDIELKLEGNMLTLKGEKKMNKDEKGEDYHRLESYYGSFTRSFTLPETVDRDKIKAEYKNGVLSVTIPQKPEVRPREIPVSVQ